MTTSHEPQSVLLLNHDLMITDGLTALPGRSLLRFEHRGSRQEGQRASEALCESEERFRALIENSSDGIALVAADGTIEYSSTNRVLGYAPSELAGRNAFDLVHLDDRPQVMKLLRGFPEEPGAKLTYVARTLHADGSWRWLETTARNAISEPAVKGIVLNYRDVTEERRATMALREIEEEHRLIASSTSDGNGV